MTVWTNDMRERLRSLAYDDTTYAEIAVIMSREFGVALSKNAVIGMAGRIGVPARTSGKYSPARYTPRVFTSRKKPDKGFALEDLGHNHCRSPIDGLDPPFGYCGHTIVPNGRPYCHFHASVAYPALRAKA